MSAAIDANMLLYAEDQASPFHSAALKFLDGLLKSEKPVYLTWDVIHAFLRIATHPGIFANPLTAKEAVADLQKLIAHPAVTLLAPTQESWTILAHLASDLHLRGNLIPDAVTASILEANGIRTIYSNDRDFWKFPALKPIDPFAGSRRRADF